MKILFLSRLFYPHIGGVEKHVFEISRRLVKDGHKVTIVTEKYTANLENYEIYKDIKIYRIPLKRDNWFKKFSIWYWLWRNRILIESFDIVHCHDVTFWFFPFKLFYFKKPLFTTFHGYESFPISKKAIAVRKISELMSWGNICIGSFMKRWYKTKPTYVSYGGVNLDKIKNQKSKIKNKRSAIFIGRLDEQTGILTYLKAYKLIKKHVPDFSLTVVGDGKYKNRIGNDVKCIKAKNNAEAFFYSYRFAFVSRYLTILEAMKAKCLVFAAHDNQLKKDYLEMAEFSKYINITSSPDQLVEKILYYLNHPNAERKIVNEAYRWVKDQSWDKVTKTYLDLWQRHYRYFLRVFIFF